MTTKDVSDFPKCPLRVKIVSGWAHSSRESQTWFGPSLPFPSCGTLSKGLTSLSLNFLMCKIEIIALCNCAGLIVKIKLENVCKAFTMSGKYSSRRGSCYHHLWVLWFLKHPRQISGRLSAFSAGVQLPATWSKQGASREGEMAKRTFPPRDALLEPPDESRLFLWDRACWYGPDTVISL